MVKTRLILFGTVALAGIVCLGFIQLRVQQSAQDRLFFSAEAPVAPVAIVLGASVFVSGQPSAVLEDRLLTAFELYQSEKVEKILVSGDHGQNRYDEVNAMRRYLLRLGVNPEDLFLDHAGFDTYDTMYRAGKIFGITRAAVVSQAYHLPRAVYLGREMDLDIFGVVADRRGYQKMDFFRFREWFARVKAVLDVWMRVKPTYLGEPIPITGDGQATWDEE